MKSETRCRVLVRWLGSVGLTAALHGCVAGGPSSGLQESFTRVVDPPHEGTSVLHVTTAPNDAEVWVGAGCTDSVGSHRVDPSHPARSLGRTPVKAIITAQDLSPGGDLELSIRYGDSARRDTRIPNADRVLRQGGSFRVRADVRRAP